MRALLLLPAALAAVLSLSTAAVAAPTPKDKADAKALARDGRKALKDKRWSDALAALKKADRLDPSAAIEVDLAQAQIGAGKLVEAQKTLTAAAGTPGSRKAHEAAKRALDALGSRVPRLTVKVKGAPAGKFTTVVDGIEVDGSSEVAVNPGDHTIGAAADGFVPAEQEVKLAEGGHEEITLELAPKPAAPEEVEVKKSTGSRVPGAVLTAIGGAGLLAGGIFGGLAFTASNNAKAQCAGNACPPSAANDIAASKTYGNVSTGAFIGGGAVALTGIVLLIVAPGGSAKADDAGKSASASSRAARPRGAMRFTPWIGPGVAGLGATGRF
jgi:hypothetical protein